MCRNPNVREVRARFCQLGCIRVRCSGSFETCPAHSGGCSTLRVNHLSDDISLGGLSSLRRRLSRSGLDL
jgi:hypothetical protein